MLSKQLSALAISALSLAGVLPAALAVDGLITRSSAYSVDAPMDRFDAAVKKRGFVVFSRLDRACCFKEKRDAFVPVPTGYADARAGRGTAPAPSRSSAASLLSKRYGNARLVCDRNDRQRDVMSGGIPGTAVGTTPPASLPEGR
jgi:hypothetical protein